MPIYLRTTLRLAIFISSLLLLEGLSVAAEVVTLLLADGRQVVGVVDARTDLQRVWVRCEGVDFEIVSGFPWKLVVGGSVGGKRLDPDSLVNWASERKQNGRTFAALKPQPNEHGTPLVRRTTDPASSSVKSLVIKAHLAQLDGDAQLDGLRIFVTPLDAEGYIVPVHGQIDFTLLVEKQKLNGGQSGSLQPEFQEICRGSSLVKREHFSRGAAVYTLAFSGRHPDFDVNIASQALLHARLGVPGCGVFEASDATVCLREPSRFRDQLQLYTPQRYHPIEQATQSNR